MRDEDRVFPLQPFHERRVYTGRLTPQVLFQPVVPVNNRILLPAAKKPWFFCQEYSNLRIDKI